MSWETDLDSTHPHRQRVFLAKYGCNVTVRSPVAITCQAAEAAALDYVESLFVVNQRHARGKTVTILYDRVLRQRAQGR